MSNLDYISERPKEAHYRSVSGTLRSFIIFVTAKTFLTSKIFPPPRSKGEHSAVAMSSSELSELSSNLSSAESIETDEEVLNPKPKRGSLDAWLKQKKPSPSPPPKKREPSPPHEYILADNAHIAVSSLSEILPSSAFWHVESSANVFCTRSSLLCFERASAKHSRVLVLTSALRTLSVAYKTRFQTKQSKSCYAASLD